MNNYVCKLATLDEMNEKWNYEIAHAEEDKDNWVISNTYIYFSYFWVSVSFSISSIK